MASKPEKRFKVWYISGISEVELNEFSNILNKSAISLDKVETKSDRLHLITLSIEERCTYLKTLLPRNLAKTVILLPESAVEKVEITLNPLWVDHIEREDDGVQKIILKNKLEHLELKSNPAVFVCDSLSSADRIVGKIEEYTKEKLALKHQLNLTHFLNGKTSHASTLQDDDHSNGIKNISTGSVEDDDDVNISQSSNDSRKLQQKSSNSTAQPIRNRVLLTQDTTNTRTQSFVQNKRKPDDDNISVRSFRSSSPDDSAGQSKAPSKARARRSNSMDTIQRQLLISGKREFTTPLTQIKVEVVQGNITDQVVGAIVNPANEHLINSGGAAKAIAEAAGKELEKECREYIRRHKMLVPAKPIHTTSGKLYPVIRYVIHIVGPRSTSSNTNACRKALIETFISCLEYANKELKVNSIAIPAISSGTFGVPKDVVAGAAFAALKEYDNFMASNQRRYLKIVKFVNIDKESTQAFEAECLKFNSRGPSTRASPGNSGNGFGKSAALADKNSKDARNSETKPQIRGVSKPVASVSKMLGMKTKPGNVQVSKCPNCGERSSVEPRTKCPHKCCINCKKKICLICSTGKESLDEDETKARQILNVDNKVSSSRGVIKDKPGLNGDDSQSTYDKNISQGPAVRRSLSMPPGKTLSTEPNCAICMDDITDPKTLRCGHVFCSSCIDQAFMIKKKCPICGSLYEPMTGNQPDGDMIINQSYLDIPGYPGDGSIEIIYRIPSGTQTSEHPNPGMLYQGTTRKAYLPNNVEGQEICELLKKAFAAKLIFTVGKSATSGKDNCVTWNDIHHKTSYSGSYGYPDPTYLSRVKGELAAKGITNDSAPEPGARPSSPPSRDPAPDDRPKAIVRGPGERGSFRVNKPKSPRGGRESPSNVASKIDPIESNSTRNRKDSTTKWYDEPSQYSAAATAETSERSRKGSAQWYVDPHLSSAAAAATAAGASSSTRYDKTLSNDTLRYKVDPTDSYRNESSRRYNTLDSHASSNQYHSLDPYLNSNHYSAIDYASSNSHSNPVSTHSRDIAVSNGDKLFTGGRSNSFYGTTSTTLSNPAINRTRSSSVKSSYKNNEYRSRNSRYGDSTNF